MSTDTGGGPAFPLVANNWHRAGMTLRDYFAAKAMQGLCALPSDFESNMHLCEATAKVAYMQADAMLKARGQ